MEGGEETVPGMNALVEQEKAEQRFARLFENLYFFLGREVPRYSLEFVIRALGGNVSWEASDESEAGPYSSGDARITHHIVDRPKLQGEPLSGRHYIQPQWVYDSINAQIVSVKRREVKRVAGRGKRLFELIVIISPAATDGFLCCGSDAAAALVALCLGG